MDPIIVVSFDDLFNIQRYRSKFGVTLQTPNLDRLASMGVTYENAFASVAVCNPSRTSAMTGLSPFQTGIHATTPLQWNDVVAEDENWVSKVGEAGYETYGTGKVFHNSSNPQEKEVFDRIYDHHFQSPERAELEAGRIANPLTEGDIIGDDVHVDWAVDQLNAYDGADPMLMTVGIISPHVPFVVPQEYFDLYPQSDIRLPVDAEGDLDDVSDFYKQFRLLDNYNDYLENSGLAKELVQGYLASLSYADAKLGELLDAIESNPNLDNASILVWSDHGYELGDKQTWNKFTLWEESANIPLILANPSLTPGTTVETPVSLLDLYPTVLDLAGIDTPPEFNGRSLLDIANSPAAYADSVAITSMIGSLSIRSEDYRLIHYNDGSIELYDMRVDLEQRNNLASDPAYAQVIEDLTTRLTSELADQGAIFDPSLPSLVGSDGNDVMVVSGAQDASGADGDDLYFVSDKGTIQEAENGGYDTVFFADADYTVPLNVEHVRNHIYSNNFVYRVTGNDQDNRITIFNSRGHVLGGDGNDVIESSTSRDTLDGGSGNDFLSTKSGSQNSLTGGLDADVLVGGDETDILVGDLSSATETASAGDIIFGDGIYQLQERDRFLDNGNLYLANGGVNDGSQGITTGVPEIVDGQNIELFSREDRLSDGTGVFDKSGVTEAIKVLQREVEGDFAVFRTVGDADNINAGTGSDVVFAQAGDDIIEGGDGHDRLFAGLGNDQVRGQNGADTLAGDNGADYLSGGNGGDSIFGGQGGDVIEAAGGQDTVFGGNGLDQILGGLGADWLVGQGNSDDLYGHGGDDLIEGGDGHDDLSGGSGKDLLQGGGGMDTLLGGAGLDTLLGGTGRDQFIFSGLNGTDIIKDFVDDVDAIKIGASSGLQGQSVTDILSQYGTQVGADAVIATQNSRLVVENILISQLMNDIVF
jgi:serralysin